MTLGSLLQALEPGRIRWMLLATMAVLAGTASMVGALISQATGKDAEPYLAGGVLGLAAGYAVSTLGAGAASCIGVRVRLLRDRDLYPSVVRLAVVLMGVGGLASAASMLMAATGVLGPLRPTSLASAFFYPTMATLGWAQALAAAAVGESAGVVKASAGT